MSSSEHEMEEERSNSLRDVTVMTPELRVRHLSWPDCYLQVCNKRSGREFFLWGGGRCSLKAFELYLEKHFIGGDRSSDASGISKHL